MVTLQCGGMVGQPSIQTIIEVRECSERSWQHYLDQLSTTERFQFVKTVLGKIRLLAKFDDNIFCHSHILDRLEGGHCSNSSSTSSSFTSKADLTTTTTDVTTTTSSTRKKSSTTTTTSSCPPYNCSSCISTTTTPPPPFSESGIS